MFLGMNSIYTPVHLPLCEYGQNQPPCAEVGLLLNMAQTSEWNKQVHVGRFFEIYSPRSLYRIVYLILYLSIIFSAVVKAAHVMALKLGNKHLKEQGGYIYL